MNPYQHSDVAVVFYKFLCDNDIVSGGDQAQLGTLACQLANLVRDKFDLELCEAEAESEATPGPDPRTIGGPDAKAVAAAAQAFAERARTRLGVLAA